MLQQVRVARLEGFGAMARPAAMVVRLASRTGACHHHLLVLVGIVDRTTNPRSCLSMSSLALVVVLRHHVPPCS